MCRLWPVVAMLSLVAASSCRRAVSEWEPAFGDLDETSGESDGNGSESDDEPEKMPSVIKEDLVLGEGPAAKMGDTVRVHYTGTLDDGTQFDSSVDRGEAFEFRLGAGMVITGWDIGVAGMKKGGKRNIVVPPELGYGAQGSPPKIPPNATLHFEIELLEIL